MNAHNPPSNASGGIAARFVGQRVQRTEDKRLLTGRGTYTDDIVLPGMLHVAFARSAVARGRIRGIDAEAARALPGVVAVLTQADLDALPLQMVSFFMAVPPVGTRTRPLADGRVACVGEPVALVIAEDRYVAEDAAGLIAIDVEEEEPVVTLAQARAMGPIHPDLDSNVAAMAGEEEADDDLEEAFAAAAHVVTGTVTHQRIAQSPMEGRAIVATRNGAELTIHMGCQSPHMAARQLSLVFGLPPGNIRVIAKDVGGSFGLKTQAWREEIAVIAATILTGHTLKWIEDRLENLTSACQAREQEATVRIGLDAGGRLVAGHLDYALNNGAFPHMPDQNLPVAMFLWSAYKMPRFGFLLQGFHTNTAGLGAYRGPWAMETLTREVMLDVAARECGFDPIEIRRKNLITLADQPTHTGLGLPLEDITPAECLDALLAKFDVAAFRAEQAAERAKGRYLGLGVACYIEPTGGSAFPTLRSDVAQLRVEPTGKIVATLSTHSQGHGTQTTMAQVIADHLGVPFEDVSVFEDDSSRGGFGAGAAGSRQAIAGGGAAIRASALLVAKLKTVAGHILNANPDDVSIVDGEVRVAGVEEMTRSLKEIAEIAYGEPDRLPPGIEMGLEAAYRYAPPDMTYTSAAHACVVEVDRDTGFVKILRWLCAEDCGTVINPAVVEGQVAGGLAQAIGTVLLEEVGYDARGNPTAVTFKDYSLPTAFDVPEFEFIHANTPSQAEGGFRGVGEGGAIIGPPTLVNAIADAIAPFGNPRCLELPLTPSRILELIEGRAPPAHEPVPPAPPIETETAVVVEPNIGVGPMTPPPDEATAIEAPAPAASGGSVDGTWKMAISSPMGGQEMTARFEAQGTVLTGELMSAQGDQAFSGTIEGDRLRWEMKLTKPMKITLKYDLTVAGDTITGKVKMGMFGSGKVTAERV